METNQPGLLGFRSSQTLSLIKVAMMAKKSQEFKEEVIEKYAQVFAGLGRLEKPSHIEKDPTVTRCSPPPPRSFPKCQPPALRERVKAELDDMEKRRVICKVEEPTDCVSSIAIVEKSDGSFRYRLDPRQLNKAIKREHFQLPTIEDITTRNAKWFTIKLDTN